MHSGSDSEETHTDYLNSSSGTSISGGGGCVNMTSYQPRSTRYNFCTDLGKQLEIHSSCCAHPLTAAFLHLSRPRSRCRSAHRLSPGEAKGVEANVQCTQGADRGDRPAEEEAQTKGKRIFGFLIPLFSFFQLQDDVFRRKTNRETKI